MSILSAAEHSQVEVQCAGINLGYGNTKVKTDTNYFQYISDVTRATTRQARDRFGVDEEHTQQVYYDGKLFEVGDGAGLLAAPRRRKTIFPFWAGTEPYMVLRQSVLDRLAKEGSEWIVTLGVPIDEMKDEEYTSKVQKLWVGEHQTVHGIIRIHAAQVAAEPSGALFYYGEHVVNMETLRLQSLTILDFGYFTTLGTTHRRLHPDMDNTIQVEYGVSRVAEHITSAIRKIYREERDVVEIECAMLGRLAISIDNVLVDIQPLLKAAVDDVGDIIINQIRTEMTSPASRIYVVGGGAYLFGERLKREYTGSKVDICDRPQQANAYGLHRVAAQRLRQMRKSGELHRVVNQAAIEHAF
jgi:hypothetical protein